MAKKKPVVEVRTLKQMPYEDQAKLAIQPAEPHQPAAPKTHTIQKVIIADHAPGESQLSFEMTGQTEKVDFETNIPGVPILVSILAAKVGEEPWTWYVDEDHVSIVARSGHKYRFQREPH